MLTHKQLRAQALKRPDVAAEFEKQIEEFALLDEFLRARSEQGLTQAEVAARIGTTQSAVARMESGRGKHSPSLATLSKYAEALGCKLEVRLVRERAGTASPPSPSTRASKTTRAVRAR